MKRNDNIIPFIVLSVVITAEILLVLWINSIK